MAYRHSKTKGFTLAEVLIVLSIFGIVAVAGITGFSRQGNSSRSSADLAQYIADNLRSTRAQAMSQGVPVAFVLPTAQGTLPHSQSFYVMAGEHKPRMESVTNFISDFPNSALFVGNTGRAEEVPWTPDNTVDLKNFSLETWYNSPDHQFIFLPTGACVTKGLPWTPNEGYQIVAASGLNFSGSTLSSANSAHSVFISSTGHVHVKAGAGTASLDGASGWPTDPSPPATRPEKLASNIEIQDLKVSPPQPEDLEEQDLSAVVRDGEFLSFEVRATDTAGGPLFCEMEALNSSGESIEGFSAQGSLRMHWDQATTEWVSNWVWAPPPRDSAGEIYKIVANVKNKDGEEVLLAESAQPVVEKRTGGKFLITIDLNHPGVGGVLDSVFPIVINDDGANPQFLIGPKHDELYSSSTFSRDGQELLNSLEFWSEDDGSQFFFQRHNLKGGQTELIPVNWFLPSFSLTADGGGLLYSKFINGKRTLTLGTLDNDYQLTENPITIPEVYDRPSWPQPSPDGRAIAFVDRGNLSTEPSKLITGQWDRATNTLHSTEEVAEGEGIWSPKYSPDGSRLAWYDRNGQEPHLAYITLGEPSAVTRIPLRGVSPFAWSPNSDSLAYIDRDDSSRIHIVGLDSSEIRTVTIPPQPSIDGIDEIGFVSLQWIAD